MKLSEVKNALTNLNEISFLLPSGKKVPSHFHLTEIGNIDKKFMDCGGKVRKETKVSFQLWTSTDVEHRLIAEKLSKIISLAAEKIHLQDEEVEVEYQGDTIEKYSLDFDGENFLLTSKQTDCLAKDDCGIPKSKVKKNLTELAGACCGPDCC